jgi:hypothetical protein
MTLEPIVAFLLGVSLTQLLYALMIFKVITKDELEDLADYLSRKRLSHPRLLPKPRKQQGSRRKN